MAAEVESRGKGNIWVLDQSLDQPMDEEAARLRDMYREKQTSALLLFRLAFQSLGVVLETWELHRCGTFALYSLLCRHAKVNTVPNQHWTDEQLPTYVRNTFEENSLAFKFKQWLEAHAYKKNILLILVLLGTCMVIGEGILTPAMSVLSAVGGIRVVHFQMSNDAVILIAVAILVCLF